MKKATKRIPLRGWSIEHALEQLSPPMYHNGPDTMVANLLCRRMELDKKVKQYIVESKILKRRTDFLVSNQHIKNESLLMDVRDEYISNYLSGGLSFYKKAKEETVIKDSINEDTFISFLKSKHINYKNITDSDLLQKIDTIEKLVKQL